MNDFAKGFLKIIIPAALFAVFFALPAFAYTTAPSPPVDCTATITGYSNADPSSAVHGIVVYDGTTFYFRGAIRLSTDGMHDIASADYGTAGNTCATAGHSYSLVERTANDNTCDSLSLSACEGDASYVNTVSWSVAGSGVMMDMSAYTVLDGTENALVQNVANGDYACIYNTDDSGQVFTLQSTGSDYTVPLVPYLVFPPDYPDTGNFEVVDTGITDCNGLSLTAANLIGGSTNADFTVTNSLPPGGGGGGGGPIAAADTINGPDEVLDFLGLDIIYAVFTLVIAGALIYAFS